ncbi:MAG: class I SAM-dependent methyltransferase [Planctomycetota bacterium]|nr:class I SAM-dependent methyltransferase [Planctomycetota bacterium]
MTATSSDDSMAPRISAAAAAAVRDWEGYFDAVADAGPRKTLLNALRRFETEGALRDGQPPLAIDLGCGTGRDTIELLNRGWRVIAQDGESDALKRMLAREEFADHPFAAHLETRCVAFNALKLPRCDLVNASYALPFAPPEVFDQLWRTITDSIRPGGRFAGQLFGDEDDWASIPDRTHHSRAQLDQLFTEFEMESLDIDLYGPHAETKYPKRWHIFHIVARKRS